MSQAIMNPPLPSVAVVEEREQHESYSQLVWRRFRRSKVAIVGGLMVLILTILAIFANFFTPYSLHDINMVAALTPPQRLHFFDTEGNFHPIPFTYNQVVGINPTTFAPEWTEDTSRMYQLKLFVRGPEYKILGLFSSNLHLYGVEEGGTIYLMGTDKLGRDLWGKSCEAGRISLAMSLFGTFISVGIGSVLGVVSGYYGGTTDNALQRFVEFVNSFPQLPLWMALAVIIPRNWDSFSIFLIMSILFALLFFITFLCC